MHVPPFKPAQGAGKKLVQLGKNIEEKIVAGVQTKAKQVVSIGPDIDAKVNNAARTKATNAISKLNNITTEKIVQPKSTTLGMKEIPASALQANFGPLH